MSGPSATTLERQALASNPRASAWVSANAGSGKTYVLVQRVVRLLLAGADPSRILCLTFTKAAAANMQNRVVDRLRGWATMPDEALAAEVAGLEGDRPSRAHLARARRLFAQALETPGGLKIYTIHAFCGRLLRQFPFEANVPAGFAEIDERDQAEMMARARARVLARAARDPQGPVGAALAHLVPRVAAQTIDDAVAEAVAGRDDLRRLFDDPAVGGPEGAARALAETFELSGDEDAEALEAAILGAGLPAEEWPAIARALADGSTTDANLATCFLKAVAASDEGERREAYLSVFLTATGQPRAPNRFVTKATRAAFPDLAILLDGERERLAALLPRRAAARIVARTRALLTLAEATAAEYARAKSAEALLDYDDLIAKTRNLLARTESAWVLFKLDGGLDHVLVDEAQDTAPAQWEIVRRLTEEFLAGAGARGGATRTVFAVGDEKQSIFSFQGAEPAIFGEVRSAYARGHQAVDLRFDDVRLQESFRSTPAVLAGVDAVFALESARKGLSSDAAGTAHSTTRTGAPGSVELWPLVAAAPAAHSDEAWDAPFDAVRPASAVVRLADRIAEEISRAIASGETPAGEILVLVRQRKALFEAVLRALKSRGVPVAGADRLIVGEHIAVMDLLALGDALTTPDDDLALACALKSPLFGLTDDDLLAIAPGRGGARLRDALADGPPRARAAHERLAVLAHEAAGRTPFAFYADLIARGGARKAYRARLGHEVDDPLDAFLDLAQDHSSTHAPTLAGFLGWMRAAPAEIKRDLDVSSGEVRVMTVHGAKGLEAGLVVLADTCGGAASGRGSALIDVARAGAGHGAPKIPVWAGRKEDDPPALASARAQVRAEAEAEHRRLLYVAMTRAKDRLIVCGHDSGRTRPEGAWYDLVREGLAAAEGVETVELPEGGALYRLASGGPLAAAAGTDEEKASADDRPPDWLFAPAGYEEAPGPPLSPSALVAEDDAGPAPAGPGAEAARARGVLLHRLLKTLPEVAPERRSEAAARLSQRAPGLDDALKAECVSAALAVVGDAAFAAVFSGAGRGEVPIVGRLRDGRAVSGRIDRLSVTDAEILVVDYKTDRRPPPPGAIPPGYAAQLAAYAELLAEIWPDRPVKAAILWTAAPRLDVLGG